MSGDPLRLGLIGAGRWGRVYIKTLQRMDGLSLVRLASSNPDSRALVDDQCLISEDWHDVAGADDLDGVIIATPPLLHADMTRAAMAASNPVLVEKPLTLDADEAAALLVDAQQQSAIVHVDHIHLYHPAYRALKKARKTLGPIQAIQGTAGDWGPFRRDVSILWDRGSHDVAMCLDLLGQEPESVSLRIEEARHTQDGPGEAISVGLTFPGGVQADLNFSNLLDKKKRGFAVQFEKETMIYDDVSKVALSRQSKSGEVDAIDVAYTLPLDQVLIDFAAAIKKAEPDLDGLRLGVQVVKVLSACQKSL